MGQAGCKGLYQSLFDYKTEKYVIAKNKKVGLLYRLLQVSILTYLVVWVFLVKKCYQDTDTSLQSSIITKVKGVTFTNTSELGERLWDVADYVIPPQSESIPDALCYEDSDCPPGEPVAAGNGVRTGRCLRAGSERKGTCEIFAWCPVETKSRPTKPLLSKAEDFTVYIKNFIRFPKFNFSKTNVLDTTDRAFLKSCKFGPKNPYCPIFRLGSVVSWTGSNFQEIAVQGGVIGIQIEWDCDLDKAPSECYPRYYFNRLDNRFSETAISSGYNFRFAKYYRDAAGVEFRTLFKAYGIRFDVMVNGKAGKFSIIPTVINVGSGVALMGVGSFFCDLVLIYFIKKSHFYRDKKYEEVRDLEVLARMAESSQQRVAPDAAGLAEQPEVQDGGGAQENGCVCGQLLQPARLTLLGTAPSSLHANSFQQPNELDTNIPYSTNKETEAQRGQVTCSSHTADKWQSWDLNLGSVSLELSSSLPGYLALASPPFLIRCLP
ncbi:P2X purinoceptor 5 isoform X2 [Hippopotamus amphibius kiboko]|uniref:P2X purinoceptor 5 isoform X2 n=1 Tax=Hippopotamus amphibius kiboko TaxID=575201 RepID=UPI0025961DB7|nr:P2X purinoceptor 5 isoform X2 [Hippopotamus amphibius kiboko]